MSPLGDLIGQYRQFLLYACIGVSGVVIDLALFFILFDRWGVEKNLATLLSTTAGITNNFFWNARYNFKVTDRLVRRFIQFYLVGGVGILITVGLFQLFVTHLHYNANIIKLLSLVPVLLVQYILNKYWSFQ